MSSRLSGRACAQAQCAAGGKHTMRRILFLHVLSAVCCLLALAPSGCSAFTGDQVIAETRLRTALDVLREVVDPAAELSDQGCADAQKAALLEARQGPITPDRIARLEAAAAVKAHRCDTIKATFQSIRDLHSKAAALLEQGRISEAEQALRALQDQWRALNQKQGAAWEQQGSSGGSSSGERSRQLRWSSVKTYTAGIVATFRRQRVTSSGSRPTFRSSKPLAMRLSKALPS